MRLVMDSTDVYLPTLFDTWGVKDDSQETGHLLMQYIEGDVLDEKWPGLDVSARQDVHSQLDEFLRQLHTSRLPAPGPLGGDLCRGVLFTDVGAGLFRSHKDLESCFDERLLVCQQFHRAPLSQPSFSGQFDFRVLH